MTSQGLLTRGLLAALLCTGAALIPAAAQQNTNPQL